MIPVLTPVHHWYCPNCPVESVTHEPHPHTRFHTCAGLNGLSAPMVEVGQKVKVTAVEREDYVGSEHVQTDSEGRPVMSVVTEREDGSNDVTVYAPSASGRSEEH